MILRQESLEILTIDIKSLGCELIPCCGELTPCCGEQKQKEKQPQDVYLHFELILVDLEKDI